MEEEPLKYQYHTVALVPDVRWKLRVWQDALEQRWGYRPTMIQVVDYLIDLAGIPEENEA